MIAILGASGYVGKGLARVLAERDRGPIHLFTRQPDRLAGDSWPTHVVCCALESFDARGFDLVINAIGAGDPARVSAIGEDILDITREWDERVLKSLRPGKPLYAYISSGVVYSAVGATDDDPSPSRLENSSPYLNAKLQTESRHRSLPDLAILDIRMFSFADAGIDVAGSFFLAQLCKSIVSGGAFRTSRSDIIRDYAGARELCDLIDCWRLAGAQNRAVDLYTRAPVSKHTILKNAIS